MTLQITTDKGLSSLTAPGKIYSDSYKGTGLYLRVTKAGTRSWLFIYTRHGRRREMVLGAVDGPKAIFLKAARDRARQYQQDLAQGGDPYTARIQAKAKAKLQNAVAKDFKEYADRYINAQAPRFRNAKHLAQWRMTMDVYAKPLHKLPLDKIDTPDVLQCLRPIWAKKPETAQRVQGRIKRILDAARVEGLRTGSNPARWAGHLKELLPTRSKLSRKHHKAMPYEKLPAFFADKLGDDKSVSLLALEFLILTAARTGEVTGARWSEIDLVNALWMVPATRMKAGRAHRVPLPPRAVDILARMMAFYGGPDSFVFPGRLKGRGVSNMALAMALRHVTTDGETVHGFRSAFRDWCAEETDHAREVAEAALAHVVGDATERAYRRGDALEKRRALMNDWEKFLTSARNQSGKTAKLKTDAAADA